MVGSQDLCGFVGKRAQPASMSNHMFVTLEVVEVDGIFSCHGIVYIRFNESYPCMWTIC